MFKTAPITNETKPGTKQKKTTKTTIETEFGQYQNRGERQTF